MHVPVLVQEVLHYLNPKSGECFIDTTVGEGGHAQAILERTSPDGKLFGIDRDPVMLERARKNLEHYGERVLLLHDSYNHLAELCDIYQFAGVDGILFDLGISSWHVFESGGGFSFRKDELLDMRFDRESDEPTAADVVNRWREDDLAHIFQLFGEERFAHRIAHAIAEARSRRPIGTSLELADIIEKAVPRAGHLHPATRAFQAIRIVVNRELELFEEALPHALRVLKKGGRIVIISYHSLEDRIVKNFLKTAAREQKLTLATKKPVIPGWEEMNANPRARSAKLRAAEVM